MTAYTGSSPRRSLLGTVLAAVAGKGLRGQRIAGAVREHLVTFCAMAAVDVGMFKVAVWAGWVALGVVLLLIDWKIQS